MLRICPLCGRMVWWSGRRHRGGLVIGWGSLLLWGWWGRNLREVGTELEVEIYGRKYAAVVQEDKPLWDSENERLRA